MSAPANRKQTAAINITIAAKPDSHHPLRRPSPAAPCPFTMSVPLPSRCDCLTTFAKSCGYWWERTLSANPHPYIERRRRCTDRARCSPARTWRGKASFAITTSEGSRPGALVSSSLGRLELRAECGRPSVRGALSTGRSPGRHTPPSRQARTVARVNGSNITSVGKGKCSQSRLQGTRP